MKVLLVFPANGDIARLEVVLDDHDIERARAGERPTHAEVWVGGAESPQDQLPVDVVIIHANHQTPA